MNHAYLSDAAKKSARRNRIWYQENLLTVLEAAKEKRVREIDATIAIAKRLKEALEEKLEKPLDVPLREVEEFEDDSLMKPIDPELTNILYKSTEKGATMKYLKERNKQSPEQKFFFRITSNWDYGWQQKLSRVRARDVNYGRCAILRDTFYRKNNLAPDPSHYGQPMGGESTICSEYQCTP